MRTIVLLSMVILYECVVWFKMWKELKYFLQVELSVLMKGIKLNELYVVYLEMQLLVRLVESSLFCGCVI